MAKNVSVKNPIVRAATWHSQFSFISKLKGISRTRSTTLFALPLSHTQTQRQSVTVRFTIINTERNPTYVSGS